MSHTTLAESNSSSMSVPTKSSWPLKSFQSPLGNLSTSNLCLITTVHPYVFDLQLNGKLYSLKAELPALNLWEMESAAFCRDNRTVRFTGVASKGSNWANLTFLSQAGMASFLECSKRKTNIKHTVLSLLEMEQIQQSTTSSAKELQQETVVAQRSNKRRRSPSPASVISEDGRFQEKWKQQQRVIPHPKTDLVPEQTKRRSYTSSVDITPSIEYGTRSKSLGGSEGSRPKQAKSAKLPSSRILKGDLADIKNIEGLEYPVLLVRPHLIPNS